MERKEKINVRIPRNEDSDYHIRLGSDDNNITLDIENRDAAIALHSAIDDMLNPWRDAKVESPKFSGSYFATDGNKVEVVKFNSGWTYAYMFITHWKEIIKPAPPKL